MRVLILGSYGQLGRELTAAAWPEGTQLVAFNRGMIDISLEGAAAKALAEVRPSIVVNCAAYTAVDKAESEIEEAFACNACGPQFLAEACALQDIALIHVSTDYVFDGSKKSPYVETDSAAPLSIYGRSKRAGEIAVSRALRRHIILRTAWLYSRWGNNFVKTMLRLAKESPEIRVVADQHGAPTSAADIAAAVVRLVPSTVSGEASYGIYHATNSGETTWHGFAEAIFADLRRRTGHCVKLTAITTSEYPMPARRPQYSSLDCGLLKRNFGITMRRWQAALGDVLDELHS